MAGQKDINQLKPGHAKFDPELATTVYAAVAAELEKDEVSFQEVAAYIELYGGEDVGF